MPEPTTPGRCARAPRLLLFAVLLAALLAASPATLRAQAPTPDQDAESGDNTPAEQQKASVLLASLEERSRLVSDLLLDAARAYRRVAIERGSVQQELGDNLEKLDREAVRPRELTRERLEQLKADVDRSRLRIAQLYEDMNRQLEDMRRLLIERDQIARRVADLRGRSPQQVAPLTGSWDVTWMPNGISGTFYLDQSGTLVTGQYKLGALGSGSLQGTFVAGKLYLQRIDSQRGRDAELEGVLEADGSRIRGTWQNFEMVQGGVPRGQWVARRAR